MPGRDELIRQNTTKARAAAASSQPQENQGKAPSTSYDSPRSFFGGNLDVYSALDRVKFQGTAGDASMRGNVAYIRLWKRGGSVQQTSVGVPAQDIEVDYSEAIGKDLDERLGVERENLSENQVIEYTPGQSSYAIITGNVTRDEDGNIIGGGTVETTFLPPPDVQKQKALSSQTPTSSVNTSNNAIATPIATLTSPAPSLNSTVGAVKSANPNGFVNVASKVGRALVGLPQTSPKYSGGGNGAGAGPRSGQKPGGEMMWQFLFNPSELELEVGPEFKNSETWGVSDKGNSGQPMHWSHNKNAQLKFNSVLLNGFVFGRKVEVLEQGLVELFMARDGEGQHGPHVLEFVWGKRVFGPCMIKNINIKEKMWDEGEVVNAEVSFTLEQVPEWTINDGFVDVARPGRLGTIGDPTVPKSPVTSIEETKPGGSGGDKPTQKPAAQNGITASAFYKKCQRAGAYAEQFYAIKAKTQKSGAAGSRSVVDNVYREYADLYRKVKDDLGSELTSRSTYPNADPEKLKVSVSTSIASEEAKTGLNVITKNFSSAMSMIENAADSSLRVVKAFSQSTACKAERTKVDSVTKEQKADKTCRKKQAGTSCSSFGVSPGGRIKSCSGIELICGADGYLKNASTYRP